MKSPISKDLCSPPQIPKNKTALGSAVARISIIKAATGEPIEKLGVTNWLDMAQKLIYKGYLVGKEVSS